MHFLTKPNAENLGDSLVQIFPWLSSQNEYIHLWMALTLIGQYLISYMEKGKRMNFLNLLILEAVGLHIVSDALQDGAIANST